MEEQFELTRLNENVAWVVRQQYFTINGVKYPIGDPNRKSYDNSIFGRKQVEEELPQNLQNAILAVWGDEPTVFPEDE